MDIYTVMICGAKFYFSGNLSEEEYNIVNKTCKKLSAKATKMNADALFRELLSILNATAKEPFLQIQIKNVFRIK